LLHKIISEEQKMLDGHVKEGVFRGRGGGGLTANVMTCKTTGKGMY
jgi:hypothetical protein